MAGGHSLQKNKAHKAGRHAGHGARARNQHGNVEGKAASASALAKRGKEARQQSIAAARAKSRAETLERRRHAHAPLVIQLISMQSTLDVQPMWDCLINACSIGSDVQSLREYEAPEGDMAVDDATHPLRPTTLLVPGRHRIRLTLLPPLSGERRGDLLALSDVAKVADVVLLCMPGECKDASGKNGASAAAAAAASMLDDEARLALQVLRSMGMPQALVAVKGAGSSLKERAAAKKLVGAALSAELPGDLKVHPLDAVSDCVQMLRRLVELKIEAPVWRRQRPMLMVEGVQYDAAAQPPAASQPGVLYLDAYVRSVGLLANQSVTVPGCGDFAIAAVYAADEQVPRDGAPRKAPTANGALLAAPDEDSEGVVRENPNAMIAEEQTWPTAEELAKADAAAQRRLPPGTSDYQACWILDDDDGAEAGPSGADEEATRDPLTVPEDSAPEAVAMDEEGDAEDGLEFDDSEAAPRAAEVARLRRERRREAEGDDLDYPDEVDTPHETPARVRFQKYRVLKSFRTSAWDPKENLPPEYTRVFAFENFQRAHKRAAEAAQRARAGTEPGVVAAGMYVRIALLDVPPSAAEAAAAHVSRYLLGHSPPLVAFALMRHETKLSVVNFSVRRVPSYSEPVSNKEELVIATGLRTFDARPLISTDEFNAANFKMERFMHEGRSYCMSAFAPITYGPMPVLVLKRTAGDQPLKLVACGTCLSCNPDRVVLKRIILTGYPVKVHKKKAIVRYMFFNPDDVKWFKPLDLWTKYGRRGRIKESVGTHGAMKCIFDAPVQQRDSVCITLYKRVFPKWPLDLQFA